MIGKTISHYHILEELGRGGMGVVYKAEDTKLKRTVALKFLPPELTRDPEAKKRFIHEAQAASALQHTNVATIHEIDEVDESPDTAGGHMFICMDYYDGEPLNEKIKGGPIPIDEAVDIAIQMAMGLDKAHKKGIVHRDIKPGNLILTEDGVVKIVDFGLAKLTGKTKLTQTGTTLGTVSYMSPEQTKGEGIDHRSDIWSLGIVLYEMLTGQLPFKGEYEQAVVYSIVNEGAAPITGLRTGIPMALEGIVNKALEKNSDERYQHVDEMMVDLKRIQKVSETGFVATEESVSVGKTKKSSARAWVLALFCCIAIVGIAGYFVIKERQRSIEYALQRISESRVQNSVAVLYFENNTGDADLDHWRKAITDLLITDLAQSKYVRVLSGDRLYQILRQLKQVEAKTYASDVLRQVGDRGNVRYVILGKYARSGDQFRLDVTLQDAMTGDVISGLRVEDSGEERMFAMVDDLTHKIKTNFNLSQDEIGNDIDYSIGTITTRSPEAYRYYIEGRNHHNRIEYEQAIASMEKAVAVDPEFAMAYRSMAAAYNNLRYQSVGTTYLQKAMALSDRVSEGERYRIMGDFYRLSEETYQEAVHWFKKALDFYPDDRIANHNLALLYDAMGQQDNAILHYEILRKNKTYGFITYENLASIYMSKGLYDRARDVLEGFLETFSDHDGVHRSLALSYLFQRKFDLALAEADKAISLNPVHYENYILKGDITLCTDNWIEAEKAYQRTVVMVDPIASGLGLWGMGSWYLLQGQLRKAETQLSLAVEKVDGLNEPYIESVFGLVLSVLQIRLGKHEAAQEGLDKALRIFAESGSIALHRLALFSKGWGFLVGHSLDEAEKTAKEIKRTVEGGMNKDYFRYYYLLMGMLESDKGRFPQAIGHLNMAVSLLSHQNSRRFSHANFYQALASAYNETGDLEKSREAYEKILTLTGGRISTGDAYARSYYMLGKIYQKMGWKGKAIEHYSQFIELWKDCDSQFQHMVDEAGEQVKLLSDA